MLLVSLIFIFFPICVLKFIYHSDQNNYYNITIQHNRINGEDHLINDLQSKNIFVITIEISTGKWYSIS
ncbi:hypothetical protein LDI01_24960 [Lentilactobacillus diolivorans]|uniref:Uncharacterized protein n=1 Tax=Lentilactobacillus diolivorans TaxID=179838 RepID=A0ABQ0XHL3_9LACO|nr:hypothetical protein LDI01_24960 [Lentilactobacillus diolivorans]